MIEMRPYQMDFINGVKVCVCCREEKPLSAFGTRKRNSDGKRGRCKACERVDRVKYLSTDNGKAKAKAMYKKWYSENREYSIKRHKEWCENNKERRHLYNRKKLLQKYGVTIEIYNDMLEKQMGGCKICGAPSPGNRCQYFYVDHCHSTNIVRGLLCGSCNLGIGQFGDDVARLIRAAQYVKEQGKI